MNRSDRRRVYKWKVSDGRPVTTAVRRLIQTTYDDTTLIVEQHWQRFFASLERQPFWIRWGVFPLVGPVVIALYFGCMWPRITATCAAILFVVYGYLLQAGIINQDIFVRGAIGIAITYASIVVMFYAESLINALKDFLIGRIKKHYD